MANYKKLTEVDLINQASEQTNIIIEDNGSLKKIPAKAMGGGDKIVFFSVSELDTSSNGEEIDINYCSSTFNEIKEALEQEQKIFGFLGVYNEEKTYLVDGFAVAGTDEIQCYPWDPGMTAAHTSYITIHSDDSVKYTQAGWGLIGGWGE